MPAYCLPTASGYGANAGSRNRARLCGTPVTPLMPWAVRDIGQRLYLSHRTISTHLYCIFPKLGITGRGELSSALSARKLLTWRS